MFGNHIYLDISSNLSFPVFWIFKSPKDYNMKNQYCYVVKEGRLKGKKKVEEGQQR